MGRKIGTASLPNSAECSKKLRRLHEVITAYRKQRGGKSTGDIHAMGLPSLADIHEMEKRHQIDRTHAGSVGDGKPLIYAPLDPDKRGDFTWEEYVAKVGGEAVLFSCPYHDGVSDTASLIDRSRTHRALAITLDGRVIARENKGDMFGYAWWLD
jgi:hypothetical protein